MIGAKKARNSSEEMILLISPEPDRLMPIFKGIEKTNPEISVLATASGVEGFELFKVHRPCLTIVSDKIEDIAGASVSTILKESILMEPDASIWLIDIQKITYNMQADFFFPEGYDDFQLIETLKQFLATRTLNRVQYNDLNLSRESQKDKIPAALSNDLFDLNVIYAPYSMTGLSGDGLAYTYDAEKKILSGFLYDVEGHDLIAYYNSNAVASQIHGAIKYNLRTSVDFTLADVFEQVNMMYCDLLDKDGKMTSALIYTINFVTNKMVFCSAGINCFYVRRQGSKVFEKIRMKNHLFGEDDSSKYLEYEIDISDIEKIYLSSDGYYSLLIPDGKKREDIKTARKDDFTLVMINLKKGR